MDKGRTTMDERFEWLRFVLNPSLPQPVIADWKTVYEFVKVQNVFGICEPTRFDVKVDSAILMDWMSRTIPLKSVNVLFNKRAVTLVKELNEAGFRCCILKGQGNAAMYPEPGLRCSGDIDVWVDADKKKIYEYVRKRFPEAEECYKHIYFPLFDDVKIDVHHLPLTFRYPVHQRRLRKWIEKNKDEQFSNPIRLNNTDSDIYVPTVKFNAVYQMGHIMIHLCDGGIGLKQLVDYFYVLMHLSDLSEKEKENICMTWKRLGMYRLATAVMWVEKEILGLSEDLLLVKPHEKRGKLILEDILEGGNFGHYSQRRKIRREGFFRYGLVTAKRLVRLASCIPGEVIFKVVSKVREDD